MTTRSSARERRHRQPAAKTLAGVAAVILLLAGGVLWLLSIVAPARQGGVGGPFHLVADDGRTVTERSFGGKYLAIYFGYTSCQDVCPATLATLAAAMARLGDAAQRVQPLFITIDPAHDTVAVMHRYVAHFSPRLIGLTGRAEDIARMSRAYGIVAVPHAAAGRRDIDHSSVVLLFGPDGSLVTPVAADASEMVMAQALARYVR